MAFPSNFIELFQNIPPEKVELAYQAALQALEREARRPEVGGLPPLPSHLDLKAIAEKPSPKVEWVIKNTLPRATIGLIVGQTGSGKTFFALNLAIWLASALLEAPFETERPQKIIFLNNEDSELLLKKRLWHLSKHYSAVWDKISENLLVFPVFGLLGPLAEYGPHGNPQPSSNFEVLKRLLEKYRPDLVFLDTFSRFFGLSENSAEDVAYWLFLLENLAKEFTASFLVVHHPRKGGSNSSIDSSRGSSVLASNTRLLIALERNLNDSKKIIQVSVIKNNYADFYPQFKFEIRNGIFVLIKEKPPLQRILDVLPEAFKKFVSGEVTARNLYKDPEFAEFREFIKDSTGIKVQELRLILPKALDEAASQGVLTCRTEGHGKALQKFYKL